MRGESGRFEPGGVGPNRGFALIGTILVLTLLTVLGSAVFLKSYFLNELSTNRKASAQSFYLAEAGLQRAVGELGADAEWMRELADKNDAFAGSNRLQGGYYVVQVLDDMRSTGHVRIVSTGVVEGVNPSSTVIEAVVENSIPDYPPIFDYALFSCGNMWLTGRSGEVSNGDVYSGGNLEIRGNATEVDGNVFAGGDVELKDSSEVSGNIRAGRNVHISSSAVPAVEGSIVAGGDVKSSDDSVTGPISAKSRPRPVPDLCAPGELYEHAVTRERIEELAGEAGTVLKGNTVFENQALGDEPIIHLSEGNLHLEGEIKLGGDVVIIVGHGDVHLEGPLHVASSSGPAQLTLLIADGKLESRGEVDLNGFIQVGSVNRQGEVKGEGLKLSGSLAVAGNLSVVRGDFHGDADLRVERTPPTNPRFGSGKERRVVMEGWRDVRH